jgi:hypothetical protein
MPWMVPPKVLGVVTLVVGILFLVPPFFTDNEQSAEGTSFSRSPSPFMATLDLVLLLAFIASLAILARGEFVSYEGSGKIGITLAAFGFSTLVPFTTFDVFGPWPPPEWTVAIVAVGLVLLFPLGLILWGVAWTADRRHADWLRSQPLILGAVTPISFLLYLYAHVNTVLWLKSLALDLILAAPGLLAIVLGIAWLRPDALEPPAPQPDWVRKLEV